MMQCVIQGAVPVCDAVLQCVVQCVVHCALYVAQVMKGVAGWGRMRLLGEFKLGSSRCLCAMSAVGTCGACG